MTDKKYWTMWRDAILIGVGIVLVLFALSSCRTSRSNESTTLKRDSVAVSKSTENTVRVDSSGIKKETTSTKETVYYPQPIYVSGKDGETKVIFVPQSTKETGTEKQEQYDYSRDERFYAALDSLGKRFEDMMVKSQSQTKVGFTTFEIIVMIVGGLMALKMFGPTLVNVFKK